MHIPFFRGAAARNLGASVLPAPDRAVGITGSIMLYTANGAVPAEHLTPGDRIITRSSGQVVLRDVRVTEVHGLMVRVGPATLGRARPETFVLLPPDQKVVLRTATGAGRDGIFAARALIDDTHVTWHETKAPVRIVHLFFDGPEIVHAGGLELVIDG